jgi:hypothetical protein
VNGAQPHEDTILYRRLIKPLQILHTIMLSFIKI